MSRSDRRIRIGDIVRISGGGVLIRGLVGVVTSLDGDHAEIEVLENLTSYVPTGIRLPVGADRLTIVPGWASGET